jgi:hypothetical protein
MVYAYDPSLPDHTFVMFKEYDDIKKKLNYASPNLVQFVAKVKFFVYSVIESHGHISNIKEKLLI